MKVSGVRIMYGVWYWRVSHVVLIVRFMHVPQLPSEGDAKGLRHLFKVRQSRAICRGCRRAPEDTHSLLESGCVRRVTVITTTTTTQKKKKSYELVKIIETRSFEEIYAGVESACLVCIVS